MEINVKEKYEHVHKTLNGWKGEVEGTRPLVQAIQDALKDVEKPEGTTINLGPDVVGDLSFYIHGLDSFQDLREIIEALAKTFDPPTSILDRPEQKLRAYWFKNGEADFNFNAFLKHNASGCKIVATETEVIPEHTEQKLKFICEGDPEWGDFGTIDTREEEA